MVLKLLPLKFGWKTVFLLGCPAFFGSLLLLFMVGTRVALLFSVGFHLLTGWFVHLEEALPLLVTKGPAVTGVLGWLVATGLVMHGVLRSAFRHHPDWSARWNWQKTARVLIMALTLFGTTCATVGLVHHVVWLAREKNVSEPGVSAHGGTRTIVHCKELVSWLRRYASDHKGSFPRSLDELVRTEMPGSEATWARLNGVVPSTEFPVTWRYLPGLREGDFDVPLLVSPVPVGSGTYVVGYCGGHVELLHQKEYDEALERWRTTAAKPTQSAVAPAHP